MKSHRKANLFDYLYNIWCIFWLLFIFLCLYPLMYLCLQIKGGYKFAHKLTHLWADLFFFISGLWVKIDYKYKPKKDEQYVFVANHFSYLDVAVGMKVVRNYFSYMGKSSVRRVPFLGYLFSRVHIQVDRGDKNSRIKSFKKSLQALKSGRSIFIMPEGGILSESIPNMLQPFKDGAFALAIEAQKPIVPISFLNLYRIMPQHFLYYERPQVRFHEPISTFGKSLKDIPELKKEVYKVIQTSVDEFVKKI